MPHMMMAEKDEYAMARYLDKQTPMMSIPRYFPTHFTPSCKVLQLNPLLLMAEILTEKAQGLYNCILQSFTFSRRLSPDRSRQVFEV
jgi:hypothetical protein